MSSNTTEKAAARGFSPRFRSLPILLGGVLFFALGAWAMRCFYKSSERVSAESATVLLEQIRRVSKLITVEGEFSEVYDYKDYQSFDISFFQKKALIRVKAKVSVGYDLGAAKIEADAARRVLKISNLPRPQILSIDHDLKYYDITEGTFNSFSTEDFTRLNQQAKDFVRGQAEKSALFKEADAQGQNMLEMISILAKNMGWDVEIERAPPFAN